jgi:hypothetical protein
MICPYCGNQQAIDDLQRPSTHVELDFASAKERFSALSTEEIRVVHCKACGGESTLPPNIEAADCDFCGTRLVVTGPTSKAMKPQYVLPFMLDRKKAEEAFRAWLKKLWFAPNALKKLASIKDPLKGIYFPFWTYDSQTETDYTGLRGIDYQETITERDSNGNTTTRTVTKTRWYPVSGHISQFFDDVLIPASKSLPEALTRKLDDWNLASMVSYNPAVLTGFKSETYSTTLESGFEDAKEKMQATIERLIRQDIGGDKQQISSQNSRFLQVTFKYIQLPVWTLTYRFREKFYQVLVNGQNGSVAGKRPWSAIKITLAILAGIAIGVGIYLIWYYFGQ